MVATNFGLLTSEDGGESFQLVCEEAIGVGAALYQIGPPPHDRLFTVTRDGISRSNDSGCTWQRTRSLERASDVFADPSDADHVLVLARAAPPDGATAPWAVFESHDGGATYGDAIFTAPANTYVTGVEIARADPKTIYVSMVTFEGSESHPYLVRSIDAGEHWQQTDVSASIGARLPRILAVDRDDPARVYLRLATAGLDEFAVYDDASGAARTQLPLDDEMSAFIQRADGTLIVAARMGQAFVSNDRGERFTPIEGVPHLRGLGERDGRLYAATDNALDGFAVAVSEDAAASWRGLLRLDQISGLRACGELEATCATAWTALNAAVNVGSEPAPVVDAGSKAIDAGVRTPKPSRDAGGCAVQGGVRRSSIAVPALSAIGLCAWFALRARYVRRAARRS